MQYLLGVTEMINYKIIDIDTYPHRAHLEYFMTMTAPHASMTANVDVTELKEFCRREGCSFFLTFLHIVALSADSVVQLRQRLHKLTDEEMKDPRHAGAKKDGVLAGLEIREYEQSPTSHTESTGDELYCYCSLYHHMPWKEYILAAVEMQKKARCEGSLEEDEEIEAFYFPTCIPWVHYTDVVHPVVDAYDSNPRFSWGKYEEDYRGRLMMPLTIAVHHGLVDGLQIGKFYANVEKNMAAFVKGELEY